MLNWLIFLGFALAGLNDLFRPFGLNRLPLEQVWQLVFTTYCVAIVLVRSRINNAILFVMTMNLSISLFSGVVNDQISMFSLQAVYIFAMPVFAFSSGTILRGEQGVEFEQNMYKAFQAIFFMLLAQGILYLLFAANGMIGRIGNSIPFIVPIIYLMIYGSPRYLILAPLAVVFSGKRIVLVFIVILGGIAALRNMKLALKYLVPVLLLVLVGIVATADQLAHYLSRWDVHLLFDKTIGLNVIDKFSSGRIGQWLGGINTIDSPFKFFFGSGSGTTITYVDLDHKGEFGETNWYVHNAFITYFVQSGLVGITLLTGLLFRTFWKGRAAEGASFTFYYFLLGIITTMFSANIVINPLFWFFSGVLYRAGAERVTTTSVRERAHDPLPSVSTP